MTTNERPEGLTRWEDLSFLTCQEPAGGDQRQEPAGGNPGGEMDKVSLIALVTILVFVITLTLGSLVVARLSRRKKKESTDEKSRS